MLCRTVHGVQDQRRGSLVKELMLGARRYDDQVAGLDLLLFASYLSEANARGEREDLVDCVDLCD